MFVFPEADYPLLVIRKNAGVRDRVDVTGSAVFYVQSVGSSHSSCDLGRRRDPELKKENSGWTNSLQRRANT